MRNVLLRNQDGRFVDVAREAGVAGKRWSDDQGRANDEWSTSAAWVDVDGDGWLDLLVTNYVRWSKEIDHAVDFRLTGHGRAYAPPLNYEGTQSYLYLGDGKGGFEDVSASAGIQVNNPAFRDREVPVGKALGALRAPALAARMLPVLPKMVRVQRLYRRYPADAADVPAWGRKVATLFGEAPDAG